VHFKGTSRSMHPSWDPNAHSALKGTVRMTKEGEVRWTSYSVYFGEERWKSESIQIGGIGSARGTLGHWFDKNLDPQGPAGPTAFWKVSNEIRDRDDEKANDNWTSDYFPVTPVSDDEGDGDEDADPDFVAMGDVEWNDGVDEDEDDEEGEGADGEEGNGDGQGEMVINYISIPIGALFGGDHHHHHHHQE